MAYCPACGTPVPADADTRFCARCGRQLAPAEESAAPPAAAAPPPVAPAAPTMPAVPPPAAPAGAPPQPPAPPAAPPGGPVPVPPPAAPAYGYPAAQVPAAPSPAMLFLQRAFTGRWDAVLPAALTPAVAVVVLAIVMSVWSGLAVDTSGVGFGTRTQIALALLLTGLGGILHFAVPDYGSPDDYGSSDDYGSGGSDYFGSGSDSDGYSDSVHRTVHSSTSMVMLTVTLLWIVLMAVVLRRTRARVTAADGSGGAEAAVRTALVAAGGALVLGLIARPSVQEVDLNAGPVLLTVWTFVISLATALVVLCRPARERWLAARPGPATLVRALRTTLIALLATIGLAGFVVFVVAGAHWSDVTGWGVAFSALFVLNLGISGLGLGWGAPVKLSASRGGESHSVSFGLGELNHVWHGWATVLTVTGGVVCALVIGVLAVRRSRDRSEQFTVAGLFTALLTLLAAFGGLSTDGASFVASLGTPGGHESVGSSVPEVLLFALLWSFGGVIVAPYVLRAFGGMAPGSPASAKPWGAAAASPYAPPGQAGAVPPYAAPARAVPVQAAPEESGAVPAQAAPPQTAGSPPAEPTVHDLGIVQPPRLDDDPPPPPTHR